MVNAFSGAKWGLYFEVTGQLNYLLAYTHTCIYIYTIVYVCTSHLII